MKKLLILLLIPLSTFAQNDIKVKICSDINYLGRLGKIIEPLICSEDRKTGFAITICVREFNDTISYYGLTVQRQGIGDKMDSSMLVFTFIDKSEFKIKSFSEKNEDDWSYFDRQGEHYVDFCKSEIASINFINLNNGNSYLYNLKPKQMSFFFDMLKVIKKNKFYVGECN